MAQVPPAVPVLATSHHLTATPLTTRATLASALLTTLVPTREAPTTALVLLVVPDTATSLALVVMILVIPAILVSVLRVTLAHTRAATSMVAVPLVVLDMVTSPPITPAMIMRALASTAV